MPPGSDTAGHDATAGRRTSTLVRVQDRLAAVVISAGGVTVLLAMLGICVFLVTSAAPLFAGGRVEDRLARFRLEGTLPAWIALDPAFDRFVTLDPEGRFTVRSLSDGRPLARAPGASAGAVPRGVHAEAGEGWITITRGDGSFELVRPALEWEPIGPETTPPDGGEPDAYVQRMPDGDTRRWTLTVERLGPFSPPGATPSTGIDARGQTARERHFVVAGADGLHAGTLRGRRALGAERYRYRMSMDPEPFEYLEGEAPPGWVFITADGRWIYAVWPDGRLSVFDREGDRVDASLRERVTPAGVAVTASVMALGSQTLLIGDDEGRLSGWRAAGADGEARLIRSLAKPLADSPVTAIRPGDRDRTVMVGFDDGSAVMTNTVSGKRVVRVRPDRLAAAARVAASPANSEVMVVDPTGQASVHAVEPGHPGVSARALFGKVPYEGYDEPAFVYQSTGAVSAEPKYSLVPLIWGTLKATVVAMLFAAPLAVLAAIYSSEFLHRRVRRYAKPSIELMASLPSVVLGFMAAMVVAPFVRDHLPKLMVLAATAPLAVVLAAHAWRMLSRERRAAIGAVAQFALIALVLAAGVAIAIPLAGPIEGLLFTPEQATATAQGLVESSGGSIRGWLNGDFGAAAPGWFVALLLPVVLILLIVDATALDPAWRRLIDRAPGRAANVVELARLLVNLALSVAIAAGLAFLLQALGFDPRNSIFGPFSQRNTLVVGMIMGIAVIPIIYTISEDAIRSVPDSLRSASLGVGATPWQTAVRVILPVAGSGIFSACMIGLGRAVGETMIVLMATGNTPEMSLNIFSGFRTLAANIAVELPEAPRASTHYRVLFLCGLVLFAMTLVINTTAELVRQHFRKRNASL